MRLRKEWRVTRVLLNLVCAFILCRDGHAVEIQEIKGGHVHEAYMPFEYQYALLAAIPQAPPARLNETLPPQPDPQLVWIPGYWGWSDYFKDFVWCSGTWRRPPPGHVWVQGYWKQLDAGWVRLKGFWSPVKAADFTYIPSAPPDQINENPSGKPDNDSFWLAGYWNYEQDNYVWYRGQWEKHDPNWIYAPAYYAWRPEGYIFVPPHWDWPIDQRGTAYSCVYIALNDRANLVYTPTLVIQQLELVEASVPYYPDHYYFFCHYSYFHLDWWKHCELCPPWWAWDWWWLTWEDHWALWWWWSHPGFSAPVWLSPDVIAIFSPPSEALLSTMAPMHGPPIIAHKGAVSPGALLKAMGPHAPPVLPLDPSSLQEKALSGTPMGRFVRPTGLPIPFSDLQLHPQPLPHTTPPPPQHSQTGKQPPLPAVPPLKRPSKEQPPPQPLFSS